MSTKHHIVGPAEGHAHTHTVIFLHGRDSSALEFASEFFESEASGPDDRDRTLLGLFPTIRWVFPTAPLLPAERFDAVMSQWFDTWSVEDPEEKPELQRDGLRISISIVLDTVRSEEALVGRHRIFLAGISQGFATALSAFLADGRGGFAGLLGLCSWMPYAGRVEGLIHETEEGQDEQFKAIQNLFSFSNGERPNSSSISATELQKSPVLLAHAVDDDVVPVANGRRVASTLLRLGFSSVGMHEYDDGGHWVNEPQGVDDICRFLRAHMKKQGLCLSTRINYLLSTLKSN